jgi:Putative transposase
MTLDVDEFISRFLIHVLPDGFHRIRHYGLFANANRAGNIALGLFGGALATAPYYSGYDYGYGYDPYAGIPAPTVWYWCDPYQGYYPAVPQCPAPWRQVVQ